jgi:DNA polymerase-3 subunit delta'
MFGHAQLPQAMLIHGAPGTGRRQLSFWLVGHLLKKRGLMAANGDPDAPLRHPDFLYVQPLEDKKQISVEQVRDMIGFLHLTSHQGGARAVMCHPAEAMTIQASNSLLKTLEEPPAGATIVLVGAAPAGLPPTLLSRCHRLRITPPQRPAALEWLRRQGGHADWDTLLDFAGGAPLAALELQRAGFQAQASQLLDDFKAVRRGTETPVAVARKWAKVDRDVLLAWLYRQAAGAVHAAAVRPVASTSEEVPDRRLQNRAKALTMRARFERVREAGMLYANRHRALNMELQLSALLQRWYGDARGV